VDVTAAEIRRIAEIDPYSLAGVDPVASIVSQSVGAPIGALDRTPLDQVRPAVWIDEPIAAFAHEERKQLIR
jgi:hypothetical protein